MMQPHKNRNRFHWIVVFAMALWNDGEISATEPGELSPAQHEILAELESRWWGWRGDPSPIVPAPKSCMSLHQQWPISAQQEVVVLIGTDPSRQESYIAEMLRREIAGKYRVPCRVTSELGETSNPVICLGTPNSNQTLADLCRAAGVVDDALGEPESFAIDFFEDQEEGKKWVLIAGGDSVGCIHGGFALTQLVQSSHGNLAINAFRIHDYPTVAVRSLRGVGESIGMKLQVHTDSRYLERKITADEIHPDELALPCLDWLARNRINCYHILSGLHNGAQLPKRMRHLVEESHRRGIKVVGGFRPVGAQQGDRSTFPCYANEQHLEIVLGHFRQYLEAGCDFIYFMADDYYPDKYAGHCEKCIAQFGDLAGEQVYMLHRIVDLAREMGMPNEHILFCPTHYDARSPRDVEYLKVFNDDPKLNGIQFTFTYLTEDVIEQRKQLLPNVRYSLFFFFGGTSEAFSDVRNSLHVFDVEDATYREITDTNGRLPAERLVHGACADEQGRMWIFGGMTTDRKTLGDLWCYDPDENRWVEIVDAQGDPPGERYGTRLACVENELYLFGGNRQEGPLLNDLYRFDPVQRHWTQLETDDEHPSPRYAPAFVTVGKRIYLFGGGGNGFRNDLWTYDVAAELWERLAPSGEIPGPRGCPLPYCSDGRRIYLFSGAQSVADYGTWINGDLYVYEIAENKFTKLQSSITW